MAITGNYLASVGYVGARKWGTGINPVHGLMGDGQGPTNQKPPHTAPGPNEPGPELLPEGLLNPQDETPEDGYTDEDFASMIWGYGPSTGTSDRPGADVSTENLRYSTHDFPQWDSDPGPTGGAAIRQESHGDFVVNVAKLGDKEETVGEGWENKAVAGVADAVDSDVTQLYMQTSMVQRDQIRAGSQISGTASEQEAPIGSWRPTWGMRIKPWSGGRRHWDMTPRRQDQMIRPFWYRTAGTGYAQWMEANEAFNYQVQPLQRSPVPDPYAGQIVPNNVYAEESHNWVDQWY